MNTKRIFQISISVAILAVAFSLFSPPFQVSADDEKMMAKAMAHASWNEEGKLKRPENWREWIFVGAPVTPNDMNDGKAAFPEFHNVYIDPSSYASYKKDGKFPDGTILIKELVSVGGKAATSGQGYFMGEFLGLEAAVKSEKHHADEPGNWAYYSFSTEGGGPLADAASAMETASCNACHQASAAEDWVFTQYYPVLRAAKGGDNE